MRPDLDAPADPTKRRRDVAVYGYPIAASPLDVLNGSADGSAITMTGYVETLSQDSSGAQMRLKMPATATKPAIGSVVKITDTPGVVFIGLVETVSPANDRGAMNRAIDVTLRRRDASDLWREGRKTSPEWPTGTDLATIARSMLTLVGLTDAEIDLEDVGVPLGHDTAQLADLAPWDALTTTLFPALREPFVDARGVFKAISRDVQRPWDYELDDLSTVESVNSVLTIPPLTTMRVNWLGPRLSKVIQAARKLASTAMTAGWLGKEDTQEFWWSDDRTQRVARDSVQIRVMHDENTNSNFLSGPDAEHSIDLFGDLGGRLRMGNPNWDTSSVPIAGDILGAFGGAVGQHYGRYEIWGTPYDYVSLINTADALDSDAPAWRVKIDEVTSNLIPHRAAARAIATAELYYRISAAGRERIVMADDYRYEPGDLIRWPDGTRKYLTGVSRELTRNAPALCTLDCFTVGGAYRDQSKWVDG